jgi:hypothetical protein
MIPDFSDNSHVSQTRLTCEGERDKTSPGYDWYLTDRRHRQLSYTATIITISQRSSTNHRRDSPKNCQLPYSFSSKESKRKNSQSKSPIQNPPPTTTSTIQNATHPHLKKLLHTLPLLLLLRPQRYYRAPPSRTPTLQHQAAQSFGRKRRPRTSLGLLFRCARLRRKPLVLFRVHRSVRQRPPELWLAPCDVESSAAVPWTLAQGYRFLRTISSTTGFETASGG